PLVADPIRLFECAPVGDGAAALILCNEKKVRTLKHGSLIEIAGSTVATDALSINYREDILTLTATRVAFEKALKMARIERKDVDLIEVHDAFTILGVIHLEDLGYARKGEGWRLVKEGEIEIDGKIPTNTMGGLKARGHPVGATGIYQVLEVLMQLRGEAGKNQVNEAEIGLAQNVGGLGGTVTVNLLRKVR
ncbi:MAG: thiolase domain-containing protein, partial [Thermoprotei archaeon]